MIASAYVQRVALLLADVRCSYADDRKTSLDDAVRVAVDILRDARSRQATVACVGNGGSATMASHLAEDLVKLRNVRAMTFGDAGLLTCLGNDCGFGHVFDVPIRIFLGGADVLVAISSSGLSENVLCAARMAMDADATVITLTGFGTENPLRGMGDVNFHVPERHYGLVESAHAALVHCLVDCWEDA